MSIKIIKNTLTEPIEIKCPYCESILQYNYNDIQRTETFNTLSIFPSQNVVKRFIVCPVCKFDISLSPKNAIKIETNLTEKTEEAKNE